MVASLEWEGPPPGSPPTLFDSKTVFLKSIGTSCRTRRPELNPSAAFLCSATHSPSENSKHATVLKALDVFVQNQGGSRYVFTCCFECNLCDSRGEREHRLGRCRFSALEGRESPCRGTRCGATKALCG